MPKRTFDRKAKALEKLGQEGKLVRQAEKMSPRTCVGKTPILIGMDLKYAMDQAGADYGTPVIVRVVN